MPDGQTDFPALDEVREALASRFGDAVLEVTFPKGELAVRLAKDSLVAAASFLKSERGFNALNDMIGLDSGPTPAPGRKRFSVLYQLYSFAARLRVRLVVDAGEDEPLPSIVAIYKSADWAEREIFDMFGIRFEGHPGLRRIYLDPEFEGHPLRKDFPLRGKS
jgi:NADH-quinone oxidoreductase subunit C